MKRYIFLLINLCVIFCVFAGSDNSILIKIGSKEVSCSEFEYMYRKHSLHAKDSKESLNDYLDLFINQKLKVLEAEACGYDTLQSFKDGLSGFCSKLMGDKNFYSDATDNVYEPLGNEVKVAHIFKYLPQNASGIQIAQVSALMDSLYAFLQHGADFEELARKYSDDKETADKGGALPWLSINRRTKEFEINAFSDLSVGSYTAPFSTPAGYHILKLLGRRQTSENQVPTVSNNSFHVQECRDALLAVILDNKMLSQSQNITIEAFFAKNKPDYKWDKPRFKGIIYYTKEKKQIKEVKKLLKKLPKEEWVNKLEMMKEMDKDFDVIFSGTLFSEGDDDNIDKVIFKRGELKPKVGYPYMGTLGKKVKRPDTYKDILDLVITDYQKYIESSWMNDLRAKYKVEINQEVLKTVNNH